MGRIAIIARVVDAHKATATLAREGGNASTRLGVDADGSAGFAARNPDADLAREADVEFARAGDGCRGGGYQRGEEEG